MESRGPGDEFLIALVGPLTSSLLAGLFGIVAGLGREVLSRPLAGTLGYLGHLASGRSGRHEASTIGAHYRHTTPEMAARVVAAVEKRLLVVMATAEAALDQQPW